MKNKDEIQAAQQRFLKLRNSRQFAHLSTLANDGSPIASYAPCLVKQEGLYVFLSQLSGHCKNLLLDKRAGVLLIADESEIRNPFARQRVSYQCEARVIVSTDANYSDTLDALTSVHGTTVDLLRQLPDFVLFFLEPKAGTYVEGFGKAFELSGDTMTDLAHVDAQTVRSRH